MRPIQYKMFDKITQKIETVSILNIESNIAKYEVVDTGHTISRTIGVECELMQSTGCKDKNEKMIYEGDIVIGIQGDERAPRYEVYFDEEILAYFLRNTKAHLHLCDLREIEIIGNIYQNME